MANQSRERVVLLHGLAESPLTMAPLHAALGQAGYVISNVGYPSTLAPIEALASEFIEPLLSTWPDAPKVHFVTHSLGGVLLHACLAKYRPVNLGRVVMTAPGLHGSDAIEMYRRHWLFRMMFGPAAFQSGTQGDGFARRLEQTADYELGVIAGCISLDPIANLFIPWPHDGKISVARTKLDGMSDHIVLPTPHDLTPSDPLAIFQVLRFLRHGHFLHLLNPSSATTGLTPLAA